MVGKALTKSLTGKGHTVTALKRGSSADQVFVNVTPEYLEGFDAVINLAGENIAAKRWSDEQKKLIVDSRVSTTSFLANALSKTKGNPKVFINASAIVATSQLLKKVRLEPDSWPAPVRNGKRPLNQPRETDLESLLPDWVWFSVRKVAPLTRCCCPSNSEPVECSAAVVSI